MKNNNQKMLVFVFIGIVILLLSGLWVQNCNTEHFDISDTIAAGPSSFDENVNLVSENPEPLFNDPTLYIDPTLNANKDINNRECAVYYLSNPNPQVDMTLRALCDQGFFDKPEVTMKVRQNLLLEKRQNNTITNDERKELQYIDWYNYYKPRLPNGACKVSFGGWSEPTKTADNQDYPIKNPANLANSSRLNPKDWAFCFQEVNSTGGDSVNDAASRASKKLADEKAIISTNVAVSPFNNSETYAKVAFNTLTLDDFIKDANKMKTQPAGSDLNDIVCAAGNLPLATGLPDDGSFVVVKINERNMIQYFNVGLYNTTTQRIQVISDVTTLSSIYKQLFSIVLRGTSVYLVPNRFNSTVYTLKSDICRNVQNKNTSLEKSGRIVSVSGTKQQIFSLVANIGIKSVLLYQSLSPDDITYGDLNKLEETKLNLHVKQEETQQKIDTFVLPSPTPNRVGLQRKNYTINSFAWGMNTPDMDDIFSNSTRTRYVNTSVVSMPKFYTEQWKSIVFNGGWFLKRLLRGRTLDLNPNNNKGASAITNLIFNKRFKWFWRHWGFKWVWHDIHFGYVYEGFILAPETGEYTIMVNSDDGGDLMIDNQIISTYYGGHWVSFGGRNGKITMEAGKFYTIRIRMLQWEGAAGLQIYWLKPSRASLNPAQCVAPEPLRSYLPKIPQINACYEEIPANAYFFYSDPEAVIKRAQYQGYIRTRDELIQQQERVQNTINTINTNFTNNVNNIMRTLPGKYFTGVDFADVSNDGNFYFYIGSFNATLSSTTEAVNQDVVKLYQQTVNICTKNLVFDSPINQNQIQSGTVQYSVAFWIRIDDKNPGWRSILFHGSGDNWGNNATIDRTPGIWILPNSTGIHFSQRSKQNVNPWTNITENVPDVTGWYHFAAVVNNTTTNFYINGNKVKTATLPANDQYMWNQQDKKLYINNTPPWGGSCKSSVLLNNLIWYNYPIQQPEVTNLYSQKPFATSINDLLNTATTSGVYSLLHNNNTINLFIYVDPTGKKWVLILLYNHRGGTNPNLRPIKSGNFPIPLNNSIDGIRIGNDESGTAAWGHVAPSYLANFPISEMAFWARGGTADKVINFRTSDPSVIRYATTGQGRFNPGFSTTLGTIFSAQQTSSIPSNAPSYFENKGDYALTEFPFWRSGQAHWGIRGLGNRWEIDDFPGNANYNTLHMVFIC